MLDKISIEKINHPKIKKVFVALSGGVDSVVLLDLVSACARKPVCALNVNHGLHEKSDMASSFCKALAGHYSVEYVSVDAEGINRSSGIEEAARKARYEIFEESLAFGDLLLVGHHSDDQLETVLFKLFRGGGEFGLSGMPMERPIGRATLYRPMLGLTKKEILEYAKKKGLKWVEDPTNLDTKFDRNYIRHQLVPMILKRFPNAETSILTKIENDSYGRSNLLETAKGDLEELLIERDCLDLDRVKKLKTEIICNLVIVWLVSLRLPIPRKPFLLELTKRILSGRKVDMVFKWITFREYKGRLYIGKKLPGILRQEQFALRDRVYIPGGFVNQNLVRGKGLKVKDGYQLKFRSGGETFRSRHRKDLSKLFQELNVPSWLRSRLPLVYSGKDFVALSGLSGWNVPMVVADDWRAEKGETGFYLDLVLEDRFL